MSAAPEMELELLDGRRIQLSDYRGQVVLVNFWGTWCPPCRMEIPHIVDLYESYRDRGATVIGVALNETSLESVQKFRDEHGITYPIGLGSAAELNQLWSAIDGIATYRAPGSASALETGSIREIPTTFVIDTKGRIYEKHVGYRERRHLEPVVQKLLQPVLVEGTL